MIADLLLLERLSDADLDLLSAAAGEPGPRAARLARLHDEPARIEGLFDSPRVFDALFATTREEPFIVASPFATFAVLLAHTAGVLQEISFVPERIGPRTRVPVFEVDPLRDLAGDPLRRLFLADLLASYTHVASGSLWVKGRHGWRHRRFSELDPAQFAELILSTPRGRRLVLYRRLGDLALFLGGVFPDFAESRPLPPVALERLVRAVNAGRVGGEPADEPRMLDLGAVGMLEWVGQRSYALACEAAAFPEAGFTPVVRHMAEHFRHARMVLNLLTDRYLFERRERWFPMGG
jgi:hypothetical protein